MSRRHDKDGKFLQLGKEKRKVRSIRITDTTWRILGNSAKSEECSIADLIENLAHYTQSLEAEIIKLKVKLKSKKIITKKRCLIHLFLLNKLAPKNF